MSSLSDNIISMIPNFIVKGWSALKSLFKGDTSAKDIAQTFACGLTKDAAIEVGRSALKKGILSVVPGANITVDVVTDIAINGINGDSISRAVVKAGIGALNATLVSPLGAMALTQLTNCAVDKAADVYSFGLTNAYNNYKNHNDYVDLGYRKNVGPTIREGRTVDDLGSSWLTMSACAA